MVEKKIGTTRLTQENTRHGAAKGFFGNLGLLVLGVLLFSLSFPNLLVLKGIPVLAWVAYIPVFILIRRVSLPASVFWGALYGYVSYNVFNYWLSVFHPIAGLVVCSIYLVYLAFLFPLLKLALVLFPKRGYLLQWLLWLAYEYLRTKGFLGYSYGVTGYSQWEMLPVIQIASLGGVWVVSALVLFPSVFLGSALPARLRESSGRLQELSRTAAGFFRRERLFAILWAAAFVLSLVYGFASRVDYSAAPTAKVSLIQQNNDPWKDSGPAAYAANLRVLKRLSEEALAAEPGSELVVWSETAFVPRIYWHLTYRDQPAFYPIVKDLMDFLADKNVPFVLGNDDTRKEVNAEGFWDEVSYNGVWLFEKDTMKQLYRKLHLVPFTEHFPYKRQLPFVYNMLAGRDDIHLWKAGTEPVVFETGRLKFSTPICFEDTFGYLSRNFVRNGAELLVNVSNDAWSKSVPAQMQHLSMAVFRAVENRCSMIRSTASGQTCAVDPNGRVLAMAEPFVETYLNVEIPLVKPAALYTRWGDAAGLFFTGAAVVVLLIGIILSILGLSARPAEKFLGVKSADGKITNGRSV
ncbi:MAG: apolipoprotein N-acyltransferase [Treponema sp.]|jgi:apolipoprotein N-acyltransferase|nr:apolipoprotein N-acyltransferase [Treponema sp.]